VCNGVESHIAFKGGGYPPSYVVGLCEFNPFFSAIYTTVERWFKDYILGVDGFD
jgi:hypothetical protein